MYDSRKNILFTSPVLWFFFTLKNTYTGIYEMDVEKCIVIRRIIGCFRWFLSKNKVLIKWYILRLVANMQRVTRFLTLSTTKHSIFNKFKKISYLFHDSDPCPNAICRSSRCLLKHSSLPFPKNLAFLTWKHS